MVITYDQGSHCWGFFTRSGVFWDRAGVLGFLSEKLETGVFFSKFFPNSKFQNRASGRKLHQLPPLRIHGTSLTTPPSKSGRKLHQLPHSRNLIDYPPPRNRAENSINYPPVEFIYPPSKSGRKLHQLPHSRNLIDYPPVEIGPKTPSTTPFTEPHRLPPLEIGPKTPSTTPPSNSSTPLEIGPKNYPIHGTSSTTPPPSKSKSGRKLHQLPPLEFIYPPSRNRAEKLPHSRNLIDYPPPVEVEIGPKTPSTTPPLEFTEPHGTSSTTPPRNRAKLGQDSLIYCLLGLYHCRCEVVLY